MKVRRTHIEIDTTQDLDRKDSARMRNGERELEICHCLGSDLGKAMFLSVKRLFVKSYTSVRVIRVSVSVACKELSHFL
jgi:hypothetical protein